MDLQKRKLQRLQNYDYRQNGAYFITICTHNRVNLFGVIDCGKLILNDAGKMVYDKFSEIGEFFNELRIDKFIVMPNHIHVIMVIDHNRRGQFHTIQDKNQMMTLFDYVRRFKTLTTKLYIDGVKSGEYPSFNQKVWQKSYHDHIIRNQQEYEEILEYIDTNPQKWQDDRYYV